jgi:hypothetical protein
MIGVPYAVLAGMIALIYRSIKAADRRSEQILAALSAQQAETQVRLDA